MSVRARRVLFGVLFSIVILASAGLFAASAYGGSGITAALVMPLTALALITLGFVYFESASPAASEVVPVAVLSAAAVVGRLIFAPLPNFKPVGAIVIVAGCVFGPSAGFMTGAISALCSNMLFGQGTWTPWQMLGFGVVGALSGLLYRRGLLKSRLSLCIFGALCGYIYGVIVDTYYIVGYVTLTPAAVAAAAAGGIVFNTIHAAANVFFLAVFGRAWIRKLERVSSRE